MEGRAEVIARVALPLMDSRLVRRSHIDAALKAAGQPPVRETEIGGLLAALAAHSRPKVRGWGHGSFPVRQGQSGGDARVVSPAMSI